MINSLVNHHVVRHIRRCLSCWLYSVGAATSVRTGCGSYYFKTDHGRRPCFRFRRRATCSVRAMRHLLAVKSKSAELILKTETLPQRVQFECCGIYIKRLQPTNIGTRYNIALPMIEIEWRVVSGPSRHRDGDPFRASARLNHRRSRFGRDRLPCRDP